MSRHPSCTCGECARCQYNALQREQYRRPGVAEKARASARASRARRIDAVRAYDRARGFRVYDPMKVVARNATRKLAKQPCEKCGSEPAQAHHDDYAKPLDVRWLCLTCHSTEHRRVA